MRFLHLADPHLDTPLLGRTSNVRAALREGSRAAFSNAVARAVAAGVDAVLIAGDLFDGTQLTYGTERFLVARLQELADAGIPVFYATGNHDPGGGGSLVARIEWPENVVLFDRPEPRRVEVERKGVVVGHVTGAGHDSPRVAADLSRGFPRPPGRGGARDLPEVALLHTQVGGASAESEHDRYAPSELRQLQGAGYHYWAIGHIHVRQTLSRIPGVHYPGNLQGRSPKEVGPKGALLVDLSTPGAPATEFLELSPIRWERMVLSDLVDVTTLHALARRVAERWNADREADPGLPGARWLLRVELQGPLPVVATLRSDGERETLQEDLCADLGLLDLEIRLGAAHIPIRVEDHLHRPDVLGEALRMAIEQPEDVAASLGIEKAELAGWEESGLSFDAYLRDLLADAPKEIVERMVKGEG